METLLEASLRELSRGSPQRALELAEASNRFVDLVDSFFLRARPYVPTDAMSSVLALQSYVELHIDKLLALLPDDHELVEMRGLLLLKQPMVPLSTAIN